jgi:hypothetical protein
MNQAVRLFQQLGGQGNTLTVPRPIVRFLKALEQRNADKPVYRADYDTAVWLWQLIFWSGVTKNKEGWVYNSHEQWAEATELSESQVRACIEKAKAVGVEVEARMLENGHRVNHYRINWDVFMALWFEVMDAPSHPPQPEPAPDVQMELDAQPEPKAQEPSKSKKVRKPREDVSPAVQVFYDETEYYKVSGPQRRAITETVTDIELWKAIVKKGALKGYFAGNVDNFLQAYQAGGWRVNGAVESEKKQEEHKPYIWDREAHYRKMNTRRHGDPLPGYGITF